MAAVPINNTARLVAHYTWRGHQSRVLYRFASGVTQSAAEAALDAFHVTMASHMFTNWRALAAGEWYADETDYSVPAALTPVGAGTGGTDTEALPDAFQLQFLGRSLSGHRTSWYFQGVFVGLPTNQRLFVGDYPAIVAILGGLDDLIAEGLTTIADSPPVLKGYANCVVNDYLTRRARRS